MFGLESKPLPQTTIDGILHRLVETAREDGGDGMIFVPHDSADLSKGGREFRIRRGRVPAAALRALRRSLAGKAVRTERRGIDANSH